MSGVCSVCGESFKILNTKVKGESRIRYIGCRKCKVRPDDNKVVVPLKYAPLRATRSTN